MEHELEVFRAMLSIYSNPDNKDRYGQVQISNYSEHKLKKLMSEDAFIYLKKYGSMYGSLQCYGSKFGIYYAINPTSDFYQKANKLKNKQLWKS
jgi:hypothetical protein